MIIIWTENLPGAEIMRRTNRHKENDFRKTERKPFFPALSASLKWIFFVSRRFSKVDRKGRTFATSFLSTLGICFGVMTLITVMSVMNGFQRSFIDAIMEISSFHIQARDIPESRISDFEEFCSEDKNIKTFYPFLEAQGLFTSGRNSQNAAIIRAVDENILEKDEGFRRELKIVSGDFDLSEPENIVIGGYLSRLLEVRVGSVISLTALSGGRDVDLISDERLFTVKGIFESGYTDINQAYTFVSLESGGKYFGKESPLVYAVKLKNSNKDSAVIHTLENAFPEAQIKSWREYNRSFFGALRVEKNILMLFVFLIFVVVAVNIYNGMRRLVFERSPEISIMSAFGAKSWEIRSVFISRAFLSGLSGTFFGVAFALALSANMPKIFMLVSNIMYYAEYFFTSVFSPENIYFVRENPMYKVYASIPARVFPSEVVLISFFGLLSPVVSSAAASRNVLKMKVAEVLRDE